jgi:hypothetical protein
MMRSGWAQTEEPIKNGGQELTRARKKKSSSLVSAALWIGDLVKTGEPVILRRHVMGRRRARQISFSGGDLMLAVYSETVPQDI